jgi:hypothetical protein
VSRSGEAPGRDATKPNNAAAAAMVAALKVSFVVERMNPLLS